MPTYAGGGLCHQTRELAAMADVVGWTSPPVSPAAGCIFQPTLAVTGRSVGSPTLNVSFTRIVGPTTCVAPTAYAIPYASQPCSELDALDAVTLSWAVVGCWVAAWGVSYMRKLLK
jgi:hypothetical protein